MLLIAYVTKSLKHKLFIYNLLHKHASYAPNFEKVGDILVSACPYVCVCVCVCVCVYVFMFEISS